MVNLINALKLLFQKERKVLETKRLDLDAAKAKLRRAKTQPGKESVSFKFDVYFYWLICTVSGMKNCSILTACCFLLKFIILLSFSWFGWFATFEKPFRF